MLRTLLALLILLVVIPSHSHAQSQAEMNATAAADLEKSDRQLNTLYQKLLTENESDADYCRALRESQRAWLKFVDGHLAVVFPLKKGEDPRVVYGSIYPMDYAIARTELVAQRVAQLRQLLGEE